VTILGARLDIIADAFYSISTLVFFAYFKIVPIWFPFIVAMKLIEFIITSKIIKNKYKSNAYMIFDKIGKLAVNIVMLMPGIFLFVYIMADYKIVMNLTAYFVTALFMASFISRMVLVLKP
jgi:CDP-diacylglycerol--glycerol-3-phosphate 3-phosphatidyltransferase